jgi:hydrogenase maturation protein HypF
MTVDVIPRQRRREKIVIRGAVQGVGFRPFIFRLATEIGIDGWVRNTPQGVIIEAEGRDETIDEFLRRIDPERPPRASIRSMEHSRLDPLGLDGFTILPSDMSGSVSAPVLPDIAACPDCLREMSDPADRRYLYPFTNCTNCGPRFSIILSLPYDRPRTTMKGFTMCPDCEREYLDPLDRRFHAQPIACPACGPQLGLLDARGRAVNERHDALLAAAAAIRSGMVVAVKGLGGFHLVVNASDGEAVERLRSRKHREEKPFALMYPSIGRVSRDCEISPAERGLLLSPEAPIVLLERRRPDTDPGSRPRRGRDPSTPAADGTGSPGAPAPSVAPGNPYLGVMLPYTPLHHLLLRELDLPVVATSGNLSDEPICIDEREALRRLGGIADFFLVHNRPIRRHVDDSIVRVVAGRPMLLRRARGFAPSPIFIGTGGPPDGSPPGNGSDRTGGASGGGHPRDTSAAGEGAQAAGTPSRRYLAVGAHLKNAIAIGSGESAFVSQHIGDLETEESFRAFRDTIDSFRELYDSPHDTVVCDMHPGYLSTQYARGGTAPVVGVQHHHAHVCACMADNGLTGTVLGVSWDGTGYGPDGTVWGGEFLLTDGAAFRRVATFRKFPLPGGEAAVREPGRAAVGLLWTIYGDGVFSREELAPLRDLPVPEREVLRRMLGRRINSPLTTSAGRLFDGVAGLIGLRRRSSFEGQAAMELEFIAGRPDTAEGEFAAEGDRAAEGVPAADGEPAPEGLYPFGIEDKSRYHDDTASVAGDGRYAAGLEIDWGPMVASIVADMARGTLPREISRRFHNTLVEMILEIARRTGRDRVLLTGGCFQNRYLAERAIARLGRAGFIPFWHRDVPPNDGGIALGQLYCAMTRLRHEHQRKETNDVPRDSR